MANLTDQRDRLQAELDSCELLCNRMDAQHESFPSVQSSSIKVRSRSPFKFSFVSKMRICMCNLVVLLQLSDELHRLQSENQRLQRYLSKEKLNVSTLEQILSESRNEQSGHNESVSELKEEIRGLKANIKCLQESL